MQPPVPTGSGPQTAMNTKVVMGCLAAFLLPFLCVGLGLAGAGILRWTHGEPAGQALPLVGVGLVFFSVPIAVFALVAKSLRAAAAAAAFRAQNPDKQWLWRKDWAEGVVVDRPGAGPWIFLGFAIVFTAMSSPVLFVLRREIENGNYVSLIGLLLPIAGVGLLVTALYTLMRTRKYGESRIRLDRIPIEMGRPVRFEVETRVTDPPADGFRVTLTCVRRVTTGAGKSQRTTESILWHNEQTIRVASPSLEGMRVPCSFMIPADTQPSDESNSADRVVWRLEVSAAVPGIDYAARFELPVFNVPGSH